MIPPPNGTNAATCVCRPELEAVAATVTDETTPRGFLNIVDRREGDLTVVGVIFIFLDSLGQYSH